MRDRSADRIGIGVGNEQISVGAVLTERIVAGELQYLVRVPLVSSWPEFDLMAWLQANFDQALVPGKAIHGADLFRRRIARQTKGLAVCHVFAKSRQRADIVLGDAFR